MKRLLCPELPKPGKSITLPENESRHATVVLRMRDGQSIEAIDGKGHAMDVILRIRGEAVFLEAPENQTPRTSSKSEILPVNLELAVLKGDAMEWAVEKAVELGVSTLTPVLTAHTIIQTGKKGPEFFQDRWRKIADQALKQCGRLLSMEVHPPIALPLLLAQPKRPGDLRLWCDDQGRWDSPYISSVLEHPDAGQAIELQLLIGPEGGFSDTERQLLAASGRGVSLGPLTLRAETATLFAISVISAQIRSRNLDSNAQIKEN